MARTDPQLNIRIPQELKDKIEEIAKFSGRSITQEIIKRLEESLNEDRGKNLTKLEISIDDDYAIVLKAISNLTGINENNLVKSMLLEKLSKIPDNLPSER